jgi:hypothetical protein
MRRTLAVGLLAMLLPAAQAQLPPPEFVLSGPPGPALQEPPLTLAIGFSYSTSWVYFALAGAEREARLVLQPPACDEGLQASVASEHRFPYPAPLAMVHHGTVPVTFTFEPGGAPRTLRCHFEGHVEAVGLVPRSTVDYVTIGIPVGQPQENRSYEVEGPGIVQAPSAQATPGPSALAILALLAMAVRARRDTPPL